MNNYKYISVDYTGVMFFKISDYKSIIDEYAKKGYCYKGYIPTNITSNGVLKKIDLIFEIDL